MKANAPHKITALLISSLLLFSGNAFAQTNSETTKSDTLRSGTIITDQLNTSTLNANILEVDTLVVGSGDEDPTQSNEIKHHRVRIDFENKRLLEYPKSLKDGEFYYLQIENINMNLYTVSHSSRDSTITADVAFPTFEVPGIETLIGLIAELPSGTIKSDSSTKIIDESGNRLSRDLENYRRFIEEKSRELQQINQDIDSLSLSVESYALHYLVEKNTELKKELRKELNVEKILIRSRVHRENLKALINTVESKRNEFYDFINGNETELGKEPELEKDSQQLIKLFSALLSGADSVYKSISAAAVTGWLQSVIHLDNNANRFYKSLPMQLTGDFTELSISINPKMEKFGLPSYSTQISFPYPNKWYIGVGTSVYWSSLSDDQYSIQAATIDSTTSRFRVVNEQSSNFEMGLSTLLYVGYRFWQNMIGMHYSFGPSISLTKPLKPRLMAGIGGSIGRKNKLVLNAFIISGPVSRLSDSYKEGQIVNMDKSDIPESVTVSKIGWGCGASLGYLYTF